MVRMTDGREHRALNAGNENTSNTHTRREIELYARMKHRLAKLQRYYDALPEPRRNKNEIQSDHAHG